MPIKVSTPKTSKISVEHIHNFDCQIYVFEAMIGENRQLLTEKQVESSRLHENYWSVNRIYPQFNEGKHEDVNM